MPTMPTNKKILHKLNNKPAITVQAFIDEAEAEMEVPIPSPSPPKKTGDKDKAPGLSSAWETPIPNRVSLFGGKFPDSTDSHWIWKQGAGWMHLSEEGRFDRNYFLSNMSDTYVNCGQKVCYISKDHHRLYCGVNEAKAQDMASCSISGYWIYKDSAIKAWDLNNQKTWCNPDLVQSHGGLFECDYYEKMFFPKPIKVYGSDDYKIISQAALHLSGEFLTCPSCERVYEKHKVKARHGQGNHCDICFDKIEANNSIYPWNHNQSLPIIPGIRTRYGAVKKAGKWVSAGVKLPVQVHDYFGVEVEVEFDVGSLVKMGKFRWDVAKEIRQVLGKEFAYVKDDGSLTLNGKYSGDEAYAKNGDGPKYAGFEITSAPATLELHREMWYKLLEAPSFRALRAWDAPTCGFHVHFSRAPITNLQLSKMLVFINDKNNRKFMRDVSGRGGNKYCVYSDRTFTDSIHPERVISPKESEHRDRSRRVALNLAHEATVEFRGFKGTVWPRHIIRNIEFCDALIKFTQPCTLSMESYKDYENFIKFVDVRRKTWPLLAEWLCNQKYIKGPKLGNEAHLDKVTLKLDEVKEADVPKEPKIAKKHAPDDPPEDTADIT